MNARSGRIFWSSAVTIGTMVVLAWLAPLALHAQTATSSSDLRATVEAALLSDPRSGDMSPAQFDAMVDALTKQVERQGMNAQDIGWRPQAQPGAAESACGSLPSFFCNVGTAFGFAGFDPLVLIALGVVSALLICVIAMLLHRRGHHARGPLVLKKITDPTTSPHNKSL